jgi:hypothetical protein
VNYLQQTTDASGFFTASVAGLSTGAYNWRAKGPLFLATAGTVNLTGAPQTPVEMGLQKAGDCNSDNRINITDFNIVKATFGKTSGDPGYDSRADFNGDNRVNITDFNLLKSNFGLGGSGPIGPASGTAFSHP